MIEGVIVKSLAGKFWVNCNDNVVECIGRGKLKDKIGILVGDNVKISILSEGHGVIENVLKRRNQLTRPPVANVDVIVVVIAPIPKPDLLLLDKLIFEANMLNMQVVICVNKCDLNTKLYDTIANEYADVTVLKVSAQTGEGLDALKDELANKLSCFAGQSAVGKSSILNNLAGDSLQKVDGLAKRTIRGKHTTRHIEIFEIGKLRIADTCGFSLLEIENLKPETFYLNYFYFVDKKCKYSSCTHKHESGCAVLEMVESGTINKNRYDRYVELILNVEKRWKNRYE